MIIISPVACFIPVLIAKPLPAFFICSNNFTSFINLCTFFITSTVLSFEPSSITIISFFIYLPRLTLLTILSSFSIVFSSLYAGMMIDKVFSILLRSYIIFILSYFYFIFKKIYFEPKNLPHILTFRILYIVISIFVLKFPVSRFTGCFITLIGWNSDFQIKNCAYVLALHMFNLLYSFLHFGEKVSCESFLYPKLLYSYAFEPGIGVIIKSATSSTPALV